MENRLIAHSLIKAHGKYLVIKRTKIKRGQKMFTLLIGIFLAAGLRPANYQEWPPLGNAVKKLA